jgi:hypothetical protein
MRRIGTIVVEKSTKLTPIAMTILTGKNDDPLEKWLSDKLKTVLSMPGILNSEKRILSNYAAQSAVYIQVISKYRGPSIPYT